jgi:serralysin
MVDTIADNTSTTANLSIGSTYAGTVETAGDRDWVRVNLVAGQTYRINLNGSAFTPLDDPNLTLLNSAGIQLGFNDDSNGTLNSHLTFTATSSGVYYLSTGGFGTETGNYDLSIITIPTPPTFTNDQIANQLVSGFNAASGLPPYHFNVAPGGSLSVNIGALTAAGKFFATAALSAWTDATGIQFTFANGPAKITFDDTDLNAAYENDIESNGITTSATINIGTEWIAGDGTNLNSYSYQTYLHEIGHALGLGHAGNYNTNATYGVDNRYVNDSWQATVMSYFNQDDNASVNADFAYIMTPMLADLIAVQTMYGTSTTTRTGNTTYGFNSNAGKVIYDATQFNNVSYTVFDNGGTDTLDYSGFTQNQRINLNSEAFSDVGGIIGNITIARGVIIENAVGGSGNDTLIGNASANSLIGGAGADTLIGGDGSDTYFASASNEIVIETNASLITGGNDLVNFTGTIGNFTLGANIERLTLGGVSAINGTGNGLANTIIGNTASNLLIGGAGIDTMIGGDGSDYYYADVFNDAAIETNTAVGIGGNDIVFFSGTVGNFTLGANIERLTLNGTSAINGTGNGQSNILTGNVANNVLNGASGFDTLIGGDGSDTYIVNVFNEIVQETNAIIASGGNDLIYFNGTAGTLTLGLNVERLALGGTSVINGTGNGLANAISGNGASNIINGRFGNDTLTGGAGSDQFLFNSAPNSTTNRDMITDFNVMDDTIHLDHLTFTALGMGVLATGAFNTGTAATQADDRIIYNTLNGALLYDADGLGGAAGIQFTTLSTLPVIAATDFLIV